MPSLVRPVRRGFTLMELIIVLAVLVAVAGIIVPLLPNMLHRANVASCTTNVAELDKIMQTHYQTYATYPDRMDNLAGSGTDGVASYVLTGTTGQYALPSFTGSPLTAEEASSLSSTGILTLVPIVENAGGDWHPTSWPYGSSQLTQPTPTAVAGGLSVATLTATGKQLVGLPASTNNKYVIFGLNKPCSLFRNLATEAPFHFADTPTEDPATFYMTFGAIFQVRKEVVDTANPGSFISMPLSNAKFVGSVAFHNFGLATADAHAKEWWDQTKADR